MTADQSTIFAGTHYLIADDGTHCYPLDRGRVCGWAHGSGQWNQTLPLPDGFRTVEAKIGSGYNDPTTVWLIGPRPLTEVTVNVAPERVTDGWALKDPEAASERFPAELTAEEWDSRGFDDEDTEVGFMAQRIYTRRTRTIEKPPRVYPTATLTPLTGGPDPAPRRGWAADQPMSLIYSPNYHHLFPGHMPGFKAALLSALEDQFGKASGLGAGVQEWTHSSYKKGIEVELHIPYEVPRWTQKEITGRGRRKATQRVPVHKTIELMINVGDSITGATKAEAAAKFDRLITEWIDWVKSYRVVACDHCDGTGTVVDQKPTPA